MGGIRWVVEEMLVAAGEGSVPVMSKGTKMDKNHRSRFYYVDQCVRQFRESLTSGVKNLNPTFRASL